MLVNSRCSPDEVIFNRHLKLQTCAIWDLYLNPIKHSYPVINVYY